VRTGILELKNNANLTHTLETKMQVSEKAEANRLEVAQAMREALALMLPIEQRGENHHELLKRALTRVGQILMDRKPEDEAERQAERKEREDEEKQEVIEQQAACQHNTMAWWVCSECLWSWEDYSGNIVWNYNCERGCGRQQRDPDNPPGNRPYSQGGHNPPR
jgi:hypothetical protein